MHLDVSCFKAFQAAAQTLNFTEASRLISMTQSGVSQHIARLESDLKCDLFLRVGKKVMLTEAGVKLLQFIETHQDQVQGLHDEIQEMTSSLSGKVSYAMPASCLLSPHFSQLLNHKLLNFPEVELAVDLNSSEEVIRRTLKAEIDFGFVTRRLPNEELEYLNFCQEEYVLISALDQRRVMEDLSSQRWIQYPGHDVLIEQWGLHHLGRRGMNSLNLSISGTTNSIHTALMMVARGLGVTIIPRHCVEASGLEKDIRIHSGSKKVACLNMIYIVRLKDKLPARRVQKVIETFRSLKN